MLNEIVISSIYYYPVKSLRGIAVSTATLTPTGIANDRRWMIVDNEGKFVTQRETPALATIACALSPADLTLAHENSRISIPYSTEGSLKNVIIWGQALLGVDCGQQVSSWLTNLIKKISGGSRPSEHVSYSLVQMSSEYPRLKKDRQLSWADSYPLHIISTASVGDLNKRIKLNDKGSTVTPDRFRANIELVGCRPYEEDGMALIAIGVSGVHVNVIKPDVRCPIPATNQVSGKRGSEPTRTLLKYRRWADPEAGEHGVIFGQKAIVPQKSSDKEIRVGDSVQILTTKPLPLLHQES